ncbi:hypothetical protein ACH5RR_010338 [Cinchona calisaya]|uniref:Uncharacterized protein n=1 Tax=Cinchona calisaya TaxID=153742 RepID=A0ABD3AIN2_9GENT
MDDLDVLARDFGFRPQGKSNPMRSDAGDGRFSSSSSPFYDDNANRDGLLFNDVFGGPPRYSNTSNNNKSSSSISDFDYDSIFKSSAPGNSNSNNNNNPKTSSVPIYDKPVYDEDIFDGLPGVKSKSTSAMGRFDEDVFASVASPPRRSQNNNNNSNHRNGQFDDLLGKLGRNSGKSSSSAGFDDLLGNLTRNERVPEGKNSNRSSSSRGFDDLLGGFGSGTPSNTNRPVSELSHGVKSTSSSNQSTSHTMDVPFVVLESTSPPVSSSRVFTDPLEEIGKLGKSRSTKTDGSSVSGGVFDDLDPLNGFGKSATPFSPEKNSRGKDRSPLRSGSSMRDTHTSDGREQAGRSSFRRSGSHSQKNAPDDSFKESPIFDIPNVSENSQKSYHQNASSPPHVSTNINESNSQTDVSPRSEEQVQPPDDVWLTVSEVPLFTQPTSAPPPSRPPPPIPRRTSKSETGFFSSNARKKGDDFSSPPSYSSYSQSPKAARPAGKGTSVSQIDELEDFAMGRTQNSVDEANVHLGEEMNASSVAAASAAAMKEAMDRAEAKFRHAKEVREREYAKVARSRENVHVEKDEQAVQEAQEREFREHQERLENERRQREEEEREQRRLEREQERARGIERERARLVVERATREARERAAAEARLKAERVAVEKAQAEARERAGRAAVQRVQAEARERAAAEARERAEKAAAEARERANAEAGEKEARDKEVRDRAAVEKAAAEARRRAERAAVERAAAEARERAAVEAREKAASAARANQQRNDNDLESFFNMGSRPSSAPRPRANNSDTMFDTQSMGGSQGAKTTSFGGSSSNMRKASSTTNIVDDLTSIFGATPSSGEFQDVEGETEERRRARLERHQRTQERAAKALAEKNQRDIQAQREQEERHRIAETLDIEIKRWAAAKEGNLRALLSTLQYVLWPECGWQPVSLTDLITGASVKKVYRKATLCIHPDKVQQKGATLQQKYIAEKVFDLLKEAWNKFNSEELF